MSDGYKGFTIWQDWLRSWWMASRRPINGRPGATFRARYRADVANMVDEAVKEGCGTTCDCGVARASCKRPVVPSLVRVYQP